TPPLSIQTSRLSFKITLSSVVASHLSLKLHHLAYKISHLILKITPFSILIPHPSLKVTHPSTPTAPERICIFYICSFYKANFSILICTCNNASLSTVSAHPTYTMTPSIASPHQTIFSTAFSSFS